MATGMRPKRFYRNMTREKAERIRELYYARHGRLRLWTQAELAALYGIGQNAVSRIVSGQVWE